MFWICSLTCRTRRPRGSWRSFDESSGEGISIQGCCQSSVSFVSFITLWSGESVFSHWTNWTRRACRSYSSRRSLLQDSIFSLIRFPEKKWDEKETRKSQIKFPENTTNIFAKSVGWSRMHWKLLPLLLGLTDQPFSQSLPPWLSETKSIDKIWLRQRRETGSHQKRKTLTHRFSCLSYTSIKSWKTSWSWRSCSVNKFEVSGKEAKKKDKNDVR